MTGELHRFSRSRFPQPSKVLLTELPTLAIPARTKQALRRIVVASQPSEFQRDTLNRFYTRTLVGDLMADQLEGRPFTNVIDLGAGEGSLSTAIARRSDGLNIVTVDLDDSISSGLCKNLARTGTKRHTHYTYDVLKPGLAEKLKRHGKFDLAVCNPPFFRPTWNSGFTDILQSANLIDCCSSTSEITAEVLFIAQNLSVLCDGGRLALIAPDGLITGWRMAAFREAILASHRVESVMQLPNHSFHDTEARCFIIIISKNSGPSETIKLLRYDENEGVSRYLTIGISDAIKRMDFDFHSARQRGTQPSSTNLRKIGATIHRGSITTGQRKTAKYNTFHTTDYRTVKNGQIILGEDTVDIDGKSIVAEVGDILMARVDRSLHLKVGIVVRGRAVLTDCVYRVRVPKPVRESVVEALRSTAGVASLLASTKGVSARLLGKADLLDMPIEI